VSLPRTYQTDLCTSAIRSMGDARLKADHCVDMKAVQAVVEFSHSSRADGVL